jgi:hypothetical protein
MTFQHFSPWNRLSTAALLALFLVGTPDGARGVDEREDSAQTADNDADSIQVVRNIAYREGDSDAWRLDLAMPAGPERGTAAGACYRPWWWLEGRIEDDRCLSENDDRLRREGLRHGQY